ncbi:N-6 DNA methylase [Streptomyces sp. NPDC001876]|uniref:N-6 DNA methylase n=1 Tax=Streptomyces sp. NPDC001876 TaxID=3154402 RepID=UPI003323A8D5
MMGRTGANASGVLRGRQESKVEKASNAPLARALDAVRGALTPQDALHFVMLLILLRHEAEHDGEMRGVETGERRSYAADVWEAVLGQDLPMRDGREVMTAIMNGLEEWQARHCGLEDLPPSLRDVRAQDLQPLIHCVATAREPAALFEGCLEHVQRAAKGGDYYTPMDIAGLLSGLVEPRPGERVYDPACGSGGFLLKADEYVQAHGGHPGETALFGQDSGRSAVETAAVNLTVHGISGSLRGPASSLTEDQFPDQTFDVVLANPPFNQSGWSQRGWGYHHGWRYGIPPEGNANFAWAQHVVSKMSPTESGRGVLLLPTAAASTARPAELQIRAGLVDDDVLSCVIELPAGLLPHVRNPVTLWLFTRRKESRRDWGSADRSGQVLLIDARDTAAKVGRGRRTLPDETRDRITATFAAWRGARGQAPYEDMPGWCRSLAIAEIAAENYDVLPSRHVGVLAAESEHADAEERVRALTQELYSLFDASHQLEAELRDLLGQR